MGDGVRKTIDRSSVSPLKEKFEGPVHNEGCIRGMRKQSPNTSAVLGD